MKHLRLFFIYTFLTLISINSVHAEENLTGMDRVYLVITTSDMADAFNVLTDYRTTEKGGSYTTHIETMAFIEANFEGVDRAEKVRNYIKGSYKNHGTRFVVLGGDADGDMENHIVPMRGLYQKYESDGEVIAEDIAVPSDRYYAYLDGNFNSDGDEYWGEIDDGEDINPEYKYLDWDYDVAVGRIAAENSVEALNHINKIITFEKQILPGTSILVGEKIDDVPTWGGDTLDYLDVSNDSAKLYDRDLDSPWESSDIIDLINTNQFSQLHHRGDSDTRYGVLRLSISDINKLSNQTPLFAYSSASNAAAIDNGDSFAEVITNGYPTGGAAAFIGNSRRAWLAGYYAESIWVHNMFQEFQYHSNYPIGVALLISDLETRGGYNSPSRWAGFSTVLVGDPAINVYAPSSHTIPRISSFEGNIRYEDGVAEGIHIAAEATDEDYDLHTITIFLDKKTLVTKNINRRGTDTEYLLLQFAELIPGEHCISARADDVHGNFSPMSEKVCFTIKEPMAPVISDVEINIQAETQEIIARVIDDDQDVDSVECNFDETITTNGIKILDDVEVTLWECPIPDLLLDKEHQVTVQAKDKTGLLSNISGPHLFKFNSIPELTIDIDTSTAEIATITGTATDIDGDLDIIRMQFDSSNYWVTANGIENYSFEAHLSPGVHSVTVEAIDKRGHSASIKKDFTVTAACTKYTTSNLEHESAGRAYTETEMAGGYCWGTFCWGQEETTTWYAVGSDNSMGTVGDSVTTLSGKTAGHYLVGACPINSYAPIATIDNWEVKGGNLTITGTATDPNNDLKGVNLKGKDINKSCTLNSSTFNCTVNGLVDGDYSFYVTAYDTLGNVGTQSNAIEFSIGTVDNCITATNYQHSQDGRAYTGGTLNLYAFAQGSSNELGLLGSNYYSSTTSLRETSTGYWEKVNTCN